MKFNQERNQHFCRMLCFQQIFLTETIQELLVFICLKRHNINFVDDEQLGSI